MLAGLSQFGLKTQHFRCRACPTGTEAIHRLTGLPGRHLDDWLMPEEVCRSAFLRGTCYADIAIVEGTVAPALPWVHCRDFDTPGAISPIAQYLNLPRVAVIHCPRYADLHLPTLSNEIDAVLIDGLERAEDFGPISQMIRLTTRRPVLGAVEALPALRREVESGARGNPMSQEAVKALASTFLKHADMAAIRALAVSRPLDCDECEATPCGGDIRPFRVACARDEIFGGYFPDTLEALAAYGAEFEFFSPLSDGELPSNVELVMFGCGHPERDPLTLSSNACLFAQLKDYVRQGKRIYAEGGGAAYLGQGFTIDDRFYPGAGILPYVAQMLDEPRLPYRVSRVTQKDAWLGRSGTEVRGYHSGRWWLEAAPIESHCESCYGCLTSDRDMWFHHHVVGSLVHLHLASLPEFIAAFAAPHQPSLTLPGVIR